MTSAEWLENALRDADRRELPELRPLLEGLAKSTTALRAADWNVDLSGGVPAKPEGDGPQGRAAAHVEGERREQGTSGGAVTGHSGALDQLRSRDGTLSRAHRRARSIDQRVHHGAR